MKGIALGLLDGVGRAGDSLPPRGKGPDAAVVERG